MHKKNGLANFRMFASVLRSGRLCLLKMEIYKMLCLDKHIFYPPGCMVATTNARLTH